MRYIDHASYIPTKWFRHRVIHMYNCSINISSTWYYLSLPWSALWTEISLRQQSDNASQTLARLSKYSLQFFAKAFGALDLLSNSASIFAQRWIASTSTSATLYITTLKTQRFTCRMRNYPWAGCRSSNIPGLTLDPLPLLCILVPRNSLPHNSLFSVELYLRRKHVFAIIYRPCEVNELPWFENANIICIPSRPEAFRAYRGLLCSRSLIFNVMLIAYNLISFPPGRPMIIVYLSIYQSQAANFWFVVCDAYRLLSVVAARQMNLSALIFWAPPSKRPIKIIMDF